jgi:acyl-CoA reductase-like NAD-dependent aldehyde dehydrogenase
LTYRWSSSNEADRVPVEDPATGEVTAVVQGGGPNEVDAAVEAAHRAFETDWRWRTWAERATLLLRGADVLEEHADELALLESQHRRHQAQRAGPSHGHPDRRAAEHGASARRPPPRARHRPAGRPAASRAPQGPAGVLTGSTGAGAAVAATAAKNITPAVLELGGKDALVVFDDADLDRAVRDALEGGFYNKGEACTATSRILVQAGIYDAFVSQLTQAVGKLKVGRGTDPSVHVGPVVTRTQQQRVLNYIQIGIDEGAKLAAQAALPADPELSNGFWVAPTLFTDVTRGMRIVREEIFGPVVTVTRFSDEDEAVTTVNESEYGLTTAIYSADTTRGFRVARRIDVGMVFINNYFRGLIGTPFGGTKHSGYGREHAIETLREFSYTKMVRFPSGLGTIPSWRAVGDIFDDGA